MVKTYKLTPEECIAKGEHDYEYASIGSYRPFGEVATKDKPDYFVCKYCGHTQIRYYVEHREDKING